MSLDGTDNMTKDTPSVGPQVDADILGALRQSTEYSIDGDERLSDFFSEVHEGCAETLASFVGTNVTGGERSVEMLKVDLTADIAGDSSKIFSKTLADDEKILFVFSLDQSDFKRILHLVLSGKVDEEKLQADNPLSGAESKLLTRVFNVLGEFLYEKFEILADRGVPRKPVKISAETFSALSELEEFTKVTMNFVAGEFKFSIDMAVPFEVLSKPPSIDVSADELQANNKAERIWKEVLRNSVETLPVGLEAELLSTDISLNEISRLVVGDMINVSFGQEPILVNYDDGVKAFMARTELHGSQLLLRVSSGA